MLDAVDDCSALGPAAARDQGGETSFAGDAVVDISHPGKTVAIAGGLVTLFGLFAVATSHESTLAGNAIIFAVMGGPGPVMAIWGLSNYARSRRASANLMREKQRRWNLRPYTPLPPPYYLPSAAEGPGGGR